MPGWLPLFHSDPLEIASDQGCMLSDVQGVDYLDFYSGIAVNVLGYDVPEIRDAIERQLATGVVHSSTFYLIRSQMEPAEKICELSGIVDPVVFFTTSGTEAGDTALSHCVELTAESHTASTSSSAPAAPRLRGAGPGGACTSRLAISRTPTSLSSGGDVDPAG
ncbi:aminotransferase class III-fold pyridoxal phosphate-dependent enzyme [Streptomyces sp. NPDC007205]|uniref:aminotransferase class III-fold pyridoxal phosphate-dependent enzyme n=1 Tax=Streptomyces sp. NPDC007205 TaxID=3154316 RepID=UPI0033CFFB55